MGDSGPIRTLDTQLFRNVFNASPIGIVVENLDGQPLFVNPAFCSMLGFSEEEMQRKHCVDFSPPEDAEKDWNLFQQLRAGSIDHYQLEKRYFRRDGSVIWGLLSISLLNSQTSPLVVAMVQDITDKKTAEEAVRASEERLRLAQWAAHIGTFDLNMRTGVDIWTPETEALYGLPPGSFGGTLTAFENLIHPDDRERIIELTQEMVRTGQPLEGEWRVVWPDGSVHWIAGRGQVLRDQSGEPERMLGVNLDITERKATEEALSAANLSLEGRTASLQAREQLLKIFVKNVPAGVAMLDRDMRYLEVSERWCTDYGVEASQILGRSHYEVFPDQPKRWKELHRRALQGETLRAEEDRWDREGGTTWVRWEIRPWHTADGLPAGILIFAEEITLRKQMEQELSQVSRKLIESQEQDRARIGRDLHDDINQQLALLAVDIEQLRQRGPDYAGEISDRLTEIRDRVTEIATDVQSLSHQLHSPQLELLGMVAAMRGFCRQFAARQKVTVDFTHENIPPGVSHEVSLCLFRVLQEALHNAVKHSNVRRYDVRLGSSASELHLTVSDGGTGFKAEEAMRSGGLGLVSMRERVRLVNGTIAIDSNRQHGTRIHVSVPIGLEQESQRAAG